MEPMQFLTSLGHLLLVAIFPVSAAAAGWFTKNRITAIVTGILPPLLLVILVIVNTGSFAASRDWLKDAAVYYSGLILTGGLAGFFASYHERLRLVAAFGCVILFVLIFLSGIR
ncbi:MULTISPECIES: hypothetical protein [unclassified Methanoregula]|uniref:hypothetical protein n=1 Tax=unclassified Methanoregula TaxID=2649730 RepID=UPI0009C74BC5|nr:MULTISPECIES: hypothetical protein [unclassified Methanoregula]OPX62730.1 MAG: hypothetical protein A4E33_02117 [Methanoregula sp. PtaB.Bin085]OPY36970.1 MAG: hypothetical protein A4E34_00150 [Methanoregula sp. PtaU1.Bin006]